MVRRFDLASSSRAGGIFAGVSNGVWPVRAEGVAKVKQAEAAQTKRIWGGFLLLYYLACRVGAQFRTGPNSKHFSHKSPKAVCMTQFCQNVGFWQHELVISQTCSSTTATADAESQLIRKRGRKQLPMRSPLNSALKN